MSRHRKLIVGDQGVILATSQAQPGAGEVGSVLIVCWQNQILRVHNICFVIITLRRTGFVECISNIKHYYQLAG